MILAFLPLAAAPLTVDNIDDNTELRYPLVMIRGTAAGSRVKANGVGFPIVDGKYIALVELKPGQNKVSLEASGATSQISLVYRPMTTQYKVLPVWLVSKDGNGRYYTTFPTRNQRSREKFDLAMKMLQCFTAEAMEEMGYGRKTFALDFDSRGQIKIQDVKLDKTTAELHAMSSNDTWGYIYGILRQVSPESTSKWVALLSSTDYDPVTKKAQSHFALGGGALAAFGTGAMDFWPATLPEVSTVFSDATKVDPNVRFDDSGYRQTVWANVATAYGAMLHELGHAFGLPHTADRFSIMSRGFDHFNRRFQLTEPPSERQKEVKPFASNEIAYWDPLFAARLNWSRWLQPDWKDYKPGGDPSVKIDGDNVKFEAPRGIRVICAESDSRPAVWRAFSQADPPKSATWSLAWLRERVGGKEPYRITVVDKDGDQTTIEDKP